MRANIRDKTYEAVLPAIEKGVDDAVSAVRDNKEGSFWGLIKSMIFKFAEMLGFEKTLAKWLGSPIPEKDEQKAVASQVADTVSNTLTDPEFKYTNKQEFEAGLSTRIQDNLKANRENTPSFSDEQFAEIANKAARSASDKLSEMGHFAEDGSVKGQNMYLSPVDAVAKQKVTESLEGLKDDEKKSLAMLAGTKEFGASQIDALSNVLGPKMAELEGRKDALKASGSDAYTTVAGEIRTSLINNKGYLNDAGSMNMDDNRLTILADQVSKSFVRDQLGVTAAPAQAFIAESEKRKQELITGTVKEEIKAKVQDTITQQTAKGVYENWQDSFWTASAYPSEKRVLNAYYEQDKNDPIKYNRNDKPADGNLATAEEALFQFAARKEKGLSTKQRDRISTLVSETVAEVINDDGAKEAFTNRDTAAKMLQDRLQVKLQQDPELDKLGIPLATIEENLGKEKGSLGKEIASGFAEVIRDNKKGAFDQISAAQSALYDSKMVVSRGTATGERVASGQNITGGEQADRENTNRRANVAANNNAGRDTDSVGLTPN